MMQRSQTKRLSFINKLFNPCFVRIELKGVQNLCSKLSIWVFKFEDFIKFKERVNVGLTLWSENSYFAMILQQLVDKNSKHMREGFLLLPHLVALLDQWDQNLHIVKEHQLVRTHWNKCA